MKYIRKKFLAVLIAVLLLVTLFPSAVFALGSAGISLSSSSVTVGNSFTATLSFGGGGGYIAGVSAYILKDVAGGELVNTIHQVMSGEVVIHPRVAKRLVKEFIRSESKKDEIKLTRREKDVLTLLVHGSSNKNVADVMFISEKTVKNHLTSIFRKLGVRDRTQAAVYALKNNIVDAD